MIAAPARRPAPSPCAMRAALACTGFMFLRAVEAPRQLLHLPCPAPAVATSSGHVLCCKHLEEELTCLDCGFVGCSAGCVKRERDA